MIQQWMSHPVCDGFFVKSVSGTRLMSVADGSVSRNRTSFLFIQPLEIRDSRKDVYVVSSVLVPRFDAVA